MAAEWTISASLGTRVCVRYFRGTVHGPRRRLAELPMRRPHRHEVPITGGQLHGHVEELLPRRLAYGGENRPDVLPGLIRADPGTLLHPAQELLGRHLAGGRVCPRGPPLERSMEPHRKAGGEVAHLTGGDPL